MTEWLGGWLRDIVLIVLTAAFVDFLVPDNAFRKYVKLTVSLMILLTILQPLIGWLKPGLDIRDEAFFAMEAGSAGMPPLSAVLEAGDARRAEAEARSLRLAEEQIAGQIRRQVSRAFPVGVVSVDVSIGPGEAETAEIKAVTLVLEPRPREDGGRPAGGDHGGGVGERREAGEEDGSAIVRFGMKPVARVEPVAVSVTDAGRKAGTPEGGAQSGADRDAAGTRAESRTAGEVPAGRVPDESEKRRLAADVAAQVAFWWGIEERRIDVIWEDGRP